jgi:hypothetical protein
LWPNGQELSPCGFADFYLEFASELTACRICVEKYPPSEFMVMKGSRLQELQQLGGEALLKEAPCTAHRHSMPLYMFAETHTHAHKPQLPDCTCICNGPCHIHNLCNAACCIMVASFRGQGCWARGGRNQLRLVPRCEGRCHLPVHGRLRCEACCVPSSSRADCCRTLGPQKPSQRSM